jgi:hypothetical protein
LDILKIRESYTFSIPSLFPKVKNFNWQESKFVRSITPPSTKVFQKHYQADFEKWAQQLETLTQEHVYVNFFSYLSDSTSLDNLRRLDLSFKNSRQKLEADVCNIGSAPVLNDFTLEVTTIYLEFTEKLHNASPNFRNVKLINCGFRKGNEGAVVDIRHGRY